MVQGFFNGTGIVNSQELTRVLPESVFISNAFSFSTVLFNSSIFVSGAALLTFTSIAKKARLVQQQPEATAVIQAEKGGPVQKDFVVTVDDMFDV